MTEQRSALDRYLVGRTLESQVGPIRGLGSVPTTEGERSLLQVRLALFGKVGSLVSFGFYLLVNSIVQSGPTGSWRNWFQQPVNQWHLATTLLLAISWVSCRRGVRTPAVLAFLDAAGIVGVGTGFALMGASSFWHGDPTLPMVLAVTHAVGVRAVLLPSSARRTAAVHALALIPTIISAYFIHRSRLADQASWSATFDTIYTGLWCGVALVMSTLTSHVIYGLSARVRESRKLGQYNLEEKIGEGGMGAVFKAHHAMLRRPTAIKLLRPDRTHEHALARFEREVQLTSRLTHPNTIAIYDYGRTPEGIFYYAMEYLDGIDLQELVQRHGPLPPARVIHILRQVAGSLGEAHDVGLIHRDVKPANVILCARGGIRDFAKVVDFGLVKPVHAEGDAALTQTNVITGTPLYMSPEAIRSPDGLDARSDLYSLGAMGYFLLCGAPVFEGRTVMCVLADHLETLPIPPSKRLGRPLPRDLEDLVLRCLAKDPDDRPANAAELKTALDRCEDALGWTPADAERWWREFGSASRRIVRAPEAESLQSASITVDTSDRVLAS